jgi:PhnB protein
LLFAYFLDILSEMTKLNPYLNFNGQAREAMEFYKEALGGELTLQTFAEFGMPIAEEKKDEIMHAQLTSGDIVIMASDSGGHSEITFGNNVHLSLVGSDEAALTDIFNKLSAGGHIDMPLAKQVWGDTFGMFTDKFGQHWMVNISAGEQVQPK